MEDLNKCTQCGGCKLVCPKNAIKIIPDKEGFGKPEINKNTCIACGLCEKVCPHISRQDGFPFHSVSLFLTDNLQTYYESSSGGAIAELYSNFIQNGAKCVGVKYHGDDLIPQYTMASTIDEVKLFRGSKYVEASSFELYSTIQKELTNQNTILFVGTPCAVSGLLNYLKVRNIDISRLYTCEFVCNGVGSPKIFKEYIHYLEKYYKSRIKDFKFRIKRTKDGLIARNDTTHHSHIIFDNTIIEDSERSHAFQNLYFKQLISNPACHICKYSNLNRVADITVGDSIGYNPGIDDIREWRFSSLILSNTEKGDVLLDILKKQGQVRSIDIDDVKQPHLFAASVQNSKRSLFWKSYRILGFKTVISLFGGINPISKMKRKKGW